MRSGKDRASRGQQQPGSRGTNVASKLNESRKMGSRQKVKLVDKSVSAVEDTSTMEPGDKLAKTMDIRGTGQVNGPRSLISFGNFPRLCRALNKGDWSKTHACSYTALHAAIILSI